MYGIGGNVGAAEAGVVWQTSCDRRDDWWEQKHRSVEAVDSRGFKGGSACQLVAATQVGDGDGVMCCGSVVARKRWATRVGVHWVSAEREGGENRGEGKEEKRERKRKEERKKKKSFNFFFKKKFEFKF